MTTDKHGEEEIELNLASTPGKVDRVKGNIKEEERKEEERTAGASKHELVSDFIRKRRGKGSKKRREVKGRRGGH